MRKIMLLLAALLILTGCSYHKEPLVQNDGNAVSVENFLKEETGTLVVGKHFQLRLMPVYRTDNRGIKYYSYQLLIAPVFDEKIDLGQIIVKADKILDNYKLESNNTYGMLESLELSLFNGAMDVWDRKDKLLALRSDFVFSNTSDELQQKYAYTDEQFDEMMRTIRVTIKYNLISSETITITAKDPVSAVTAREAKEIGRDDLYGISRFGEYYPVISGVYEGESYPVGEVRRTFKTEEIWNKALEVFADRYPEHGNDIYITEGYSFYNYFRTNEGITAHQTRAAGYFLFDGDELLGLLVSGLETGYEYYDISKMGSFMETIRQNDYFQLLDLENGNTLMIWTPIELISLKGGQNIKEYEEFFKDMFPSGEAVEPYEREWKNLYNHRFVLEDK